MATMSGSYSSDDEQQQDGSLSCRLKLRLHAKALPLIGRVRAPDCWCVVTAVGDSPHRGSFRFVELGETERIEKSCKPQWLKPIWIDYTYGTKLYFQVKVLRHSNSKGHKVVGSALFEVSNVLGSNNTKVKRFPNGGVVMAYLRVIPPYNHAIFRFRLRTMTLKLPTNVFGSKRFTDTMLELARLKESAAAGKSWVAIYRSTPVLESELPSWDEAEVQLDAEEDLTWPIRFLVWDKKRKYLIGSVVTTLHQVMDSLIQDDFEGESERDLVLAKKGKEVGRLRVVKARVVSSKQVEAEVSSHNFDYKPSSPRQPTRTASLIARELSFRDFGNAGGGINFSVAVDFTGTNGDPRKTESLHYVLDCESNNDYQEVIQEVGTAVVQLSSDTPTECNIWGFGAKFGNEVKHIFQCGTPVVEGVDGLLEAYRGMFEHELIMSFPTVFDSVIQAAAVKSRPYHVSLLLRNSGQNNFLCIKCISLTIASGNRITWSKIRCALDCN